MSVSEVPRDKPFTGICQCGHDVDTHDPLIPMPCERCGCAAFQEDPDA